MKINVLRGQNQIGGSIIEISSESTRLIFDIGHELDTDCQVLPNIEGLFLGNASYDGVFISHYHADHMGFLSEVLPNINVYMGEGCYKVHQFQNEWSNKPKMPKPYFLKDSVTIEIRDLKVTPYLCDHSAFDAYMFLIEQGAKKILYTGDFRSNGRKSFSSLLKKLPQVDVLIIEGTLLTQNDSKNLFEHDLEKQIFEDMENKHPVFFLQSSTNIDRIVTNYKASKKHRKLFLQDLYMAGITSAIGDNIPNPRTFNDVKVFITSNSTDKYHLLESYGNKKIGRRAIAKENFAMCIRSSMIRDLEELSKLVSFENGILFYSMWEGYKDKDEKMKDLLEFMKSKDVEIVDAHTSGHADKKTIEELITQVNPKTIIPVHTKKPSWFERYSDKEVIINEDLLYV